MTTQITIKNDGPYVVIVQRGDEPPVTLAPLETHTLHMWADAPLKIVEPVGFHQSVESYQQLV